MKEIDVYIRMSRDELVDARLVDVEARVYDRTHGYVEIEATGMVRDCPDGSFSAGEIIVSSSASALRVSVVFSGCGMVNVTTFAVL